MVERIRTLLESRQLTPTQFADLIGVARPIVSHILSGRNKPSLDVVQRILAAMPDLSMAWLLNGTEPMLAAPRDTVSAMPLPALTEAPASLVAAASSQPVAVAHVSMPLFASQLAASPSSTAVNHSFVGQIPAADMALAPEAVPVVSAKHLAVEPAMVAAMVPAAQLMGQTVHRHPMPRRFSAKPSVPIQPTYASPADAVVPSTSRVPAPDSIPATAEADVPLVEASAAASVVTAVKASIGTEITDKMRLAAAATAATEPGESSAIAVSPTDEVAPKAVTPNQTLPATENAQAEAPASSVGAAPFTVPSLVGDMASAILTGADKPIRRIVIFYRDGSFADYQPE